MSVISYVGEPNGTSIDVSPSHPLPTAQKTTRPNGVAAMKQLTVSSSVVQIETGGFVFADSTQVVDVQVLTANVYVTFDGSTPSATNGFTLYAGTTSKWGILRAKIAKFIRVTTDATLNIGQSIYG